MDFVYCSRFEAATNRACRTHDISDRTVVALVGLVEKLAPFGVSLKAAPRLEQKHRALPLDANYRQEHKTGGGPSLTQRCCAIPFRGSPCAHVSPAASFVQVF
jgi:hypothetical protein